MLIAKELQEISLKLENIVADSSTEWSEGTSGNTWFSLPYEAEKNWPELQMGVYARFDYRYTTTGNASSHATLYCDAGHTTTPAQVVNPQPDTEYNGISAFVPLYGGVSATEGRIYQGANSSVTGYFRNVMIVPLSQSMIERLRDRFPTDMDILNFLDSLPYFSFSIPVDKSWVSFEKDIIKAGEFLEPSGVTAFGLEAEYPNVADLPDNVAFRILPEGCAVADLFEEDASIEKIEIKTPISN